MMNGDEITPSESQRASLNFTYKKYVGRADYDPEDRVYRGRVLGIGDVITFVGSDEEVAEREFQRSMEDYFEFCKENGDDPEKPNFFEWCGERLPCEPIMRNGIPLWRAQFGSQSHMFPRKTREHEYDN